MLTHDVCWTHAPGTTCCGRFVCEYPQHWELRCQYCSALFTPGQSVAAERQYCPARNEGGGLLGMLERMQQRGQIVKYSVTLRDDKTVCISVTPQVWLPFIDIELGFDFGEDL